MGNELFLMVSDAAKLAGLSEKGIYALIRNQKIPVSQELVGRYRRYKIPATPFLVWLERDINRLEQKTISLKRSHRILKERIHG